MNRIDRESRIVVIGGGTGLSVLLKGLKKLTTNVTAVVTVSDDGGSSGRLRAELGVLPPGDIRSCLVALADTETLMDEVIQHRFQTGEGLKGHSLGNLLLVAMTEITGDFITAIKEVSKVLKVRGNVLPATLEHVTLKALMSDGKMVSGETLIRNYKYKIERLFLKPEYCRPVPETLNAIRDADAIIVGPGSLYTSIIPNLLVDGVVDAIADSNAVTMYVSNIMTEQGETDDFTAYDHLKVILEHINKQIFNYVIMNSGNIDKYRLERYKEEKAIPVRKALQEINDLGVKVIEEDLVSQADFAWHDSDKLAKVIMKTIGR
ncbi:LPPG:FO 2-phospho-L-lactate transferase like, CofD-like [Candidatus Syntrophocurvum alkaliphilum]|uniref:Putative gluconeogenesis factor n=1 Tax=Candidatus Syntrophocurvum alkaliphilum TaxID=2293317 RepID=A0A6I6DM37_9FIRM|nr:gluconeogenesis factor YvcK family protein [Candidatus Syntrophocurvum alkaliphilum]QGU00361.1 LPPG:FO 2-phospho-L-lactate transferase like, CofD-like [Candidatus Syntrophocurvum alkaliphilum]